MDQAFATGYPVDQFAPHPDEGGLERLSGQRPGAICLKQRAHVGGKGRIGEFLEYALARLGPGNHHLRLFKVEPETFDDPGRVQPLEHRERVIEVEQITGLVALKQSPQLGRQHFLPREGGDRGLAGEPLIFDAERYLDGRIAGFPLACADFDLEPYARVYQVALVFP